MWSHPTRVLTLLTAFLTVLAGVQFHAAADHADEGASISASHVESDCGGNARSETAEEERQEEEEKSSVHLFIHHGSPADAPVDRSNSVSFPGIGDLARLIRAVPLIRGPPAA